MAGNQTDNLMLLDLTTGLPRTPETGGTPDTIQLSVDMELTSGANMLIDGDLTVRGTTTTFNSETVKIGDNHLYLNDGYTTTVAQSGGLVINVLPTATTDTVAATGFVAGIPATSNPTVNTVGAATFTAGDLIQISGANNEANNGLFEVLTHAANLLTIRGVGTTSTTVSWVQNQFTTDTTVAGTITLVNVNVLLGDSAGDWSTATSSSTTGITFSTITKQGVVDLQEAYEQGNTITTDAGNGAVVISGTEELTVTATGGINLDTVFDFDGTSFDVLMAGANGFSIDGGAASNVSVTSGDLTLSTITSGSVLVDGTSGVEINSTGGPLQIGNDADAQNINIGTGAAARTITVGNATGATGVDFDSGTGAFSFDSTVAETVPLMVLTTTGTNGDSVDLFVGDSDPSGTVTGQAGSLFMRDTGTSGILYVNQSTGSGTTWNRVVTAGPGGTLTLQSAYEGGNTITTDATNGDFDVSGTQAISLDASLASNFSVAGANLTLETTTSGSLIATAAGLMDLNAGANLDVDVTGTMDFLSTGAFSIDGTGASNVTADTGALTLSTTTSGNVVVNSVADVDVDGVNILADATGGISLDAATSSNFTVTGNAAGATDLTLSATNAGAGTGNLLASADDEVDLTSGGLMDMNAGANLDIDVTGTFDMLATGVFSIDGTGASNVTADSGTLTLSTTTSGNVDVTSVDVVNVTAGDEAAAAGNAVNVSAGDGGGANNGGAINLTAGLSGAGATGNGGSVNITAGDAASTDGDGGVILLATGSNTGTGTEGFVNITGTQSETEAILQLAPTGTNAQTVQFYTGTSSPSGAVTADAGSLYLRDTGSSGEVWVNSSTGSGTTWTMLSTAAGATLQSAYEGGNTITTSATEGDITFTGTEDFIVTLSDLLVDTTASISLDADAASNFTVDGGNLTLSTTTTGTIDITSADDIQVTFETNNATAMVIDDGTNNFITFDSTTGDLAVEVNEFLDIVGDGGGVTLTAGATIAVGDAVSLNSAGDVILADSNTGTDEDAYCIGIAATAATATNPVRVYSVTGSLVAVNFAAAPGAATNGSIVFVSATGGQGTITAPTGMGNILYKIGILQGADGATTTPLVLLQPQFLAKRP